jgi:hypothetical protein
MRKAFSVLILSIIALVHIGIFTNQITTKTGKENDGITNQQRHFGTNYDSRHHYGTSGYWFPRSHRFQELESRFQHRGTWRQLASIRKG